MTLTQLGNLSIEHFLRDYWQQKPVLIKNALPHWQPPLSPDELAGLALEPEVESRLVLEQYQGKPWALKQGPFSEQDFQNLPERNWTLLVQAVDHWVPEAMNLLDQFRFIPNWRLDDLMVSYAPDGGSVGPHYDQYDVFLIQGLGQREWRIGQACNATTPCLDNTPLHILADFEQLANYTLSTGDILYLPPGIAHWGIAIGDSMTYSVGFRAPSVAEMVDDFAAEICANLTEDQRLTDVTRANVEAGEIDPATLAQVQHQIINALQQPQALARWFGQYMTAPKYLSDQPVQSTDLTEQVLVDAASQLVDNPPLYQAPDSRFAYAGDCLFVNGEAFPCNTRLAAALANNRCCNNWHIHINNAQERLLLARLVALEWLWLDDPRTP